MYKISLILISIFSVALTNCDGRKTKSEALKESVEKFRDSIEPINIVEYIPKVYSEVKTDTILSNGFVVKIKNYTDMQNSVSHNYQVDSITTRTDIYRKWISEVSVEKDGKLIFNKIINDDFFLSEVDNNQKALTRAITSGVHFDQELYPDNASIKLYAELTYPDTEGGLVFIIRMDKSGKYTIKTMPT